MKVTWQGVVLGAALTVVLYKSGYITKLPVVGKFA